MNKLRYLTAVLFAALFCWISFFPQPVQDKYGIYARVFLGFFLLAFILDNKCRRRLFSLCDWPLWLFLISLLAGTVSATDKNVAWKAYFYITITLFFIFYIGKGLYLNTKNQNIVSLVICICSSLVALIGILELSFGKNILYENFIDNPFYERYIRFNPRLMSTQLNPAVLGSYLLGCLPFSFYLFKNKSLCLRLLGIFSSLLGAAVILLTFSRGVMLGLVALLLFYLWNSRKQKMFSLLLFSLIPLVLICSCQKSINFNRFGFNRFISGSYDSIISEYRLNRVNMTLKISKDYPLFGIGFNHFRSRFNEYCVEKDKGRELYEFMVPDNMYLTFLAETGLVGIFGFLIFIIFLFKNGLKKIKESLIPMSALVGLLVNMGGYDLFYWSNPYILFCLICGLIQGATCYFRVNSGPEKI